jgi:methylthioribose-1-phosphate isomerase
MDSAGPIRLGHFTLTAEALPTTWIIDSSASHHMYNGRKSAYLTYRYLPNRYQIGRQSQKSLRRWHRPLHPIEAATTKWHQTRSDAHEMESDARPGRSDTQEMASVAQPDRSGTHELASAVPPDQSGTQKMVSVAQPARRSTQELLSVARSGQMAPRRWCRKSLQHQAD